MELVSIPYTKHEGIQCLRFLCISWVAFFHFFSHRSHLFPYSGKTENLITDTGWLGVMFFFIISGYVIESSLAKSVNYLSFLGKRALRLYPSIFLILPVVYLVQKHTPRSPFQDTSTVPNLIVSMFLIPPNTLNYSFGTQLSWLTLVLWSLKVEVFFYILISMIHFSRFKQLKGWILFFICLISTFTQFVFSSLPNPGSFMTSLQSLTEMLGWNYLVWFLIGVCAHKIKVSQEVSAKNSLALITYCAISTFSLLYMENKNAFVLALLLMPFCLITIFKFERMFRLFRMFVRGGDSSYEMYLAHQGIGIPVTLFVCEKLALSSLESLVLNILAIGALFLFSHLVYFIVEQAKKAWS